MSNKQKFSLVKLVEYGSCVDSTGTVQHYVGLYKDWVVTVDADACVPVMWTLTGKGGNKMRLVTSEDTVNE